MSLIWAWPYTRFLCDLIDGRLTINSQGIISMAKRSKSYLVEALSKVYHLEEALSDFTMSNLGSPMLGQRVVVSQSS